MKSSHFIWWFLTFTLLLIVCFIIICKICNDYWKRKGVFNLQPSLFFGNVKDVVLQKEGLGVNLKKYYDTLKQNGKSFGGYYFLIKPMLVISDLELIKRILITDFTHFTDHPFYMNKEKDPLSWNLFAIKGEEWKNLRAKLLPAFSLSKLRLFFEGIFESCEELHVIIDKTMEKEKNINLYDMFSKLTVNITGSCIFGINCNSFSTSHNKFKEYGLQYLHPKSAWAQLTFVLSFIFPEVFQKFNFNTRNEEATNFFMKLTEDLIKHRKQNNIVRNDFMHILLETKNNVSCNSNETSITRYKNEEGFSMQELAALCFSFFIGGYEATSTTMTFCMYELSLDRKLQGKVRNEIMTVLKNHDGNITYSSLMEMKFLDQCINETLRKYPPASNHIRICTKSYKIPNSDVVITKGTQLFIPVYGIHMDLNYYPNPDIFDPERFSEMGKNGRPSGTWIPFGDGPRMCIAYQFGLLQIKTALVVLLRKYEFSIHRSTRLPITICPKNAILFPSSDIFVSATKI